MSFLKADVSFLTMKFTLPDLLNRFVHQVFNELTC